MSLLRELQELGLAPKEAQVYMALLELGTSSVQAIARRARMVRPTTYVVLEHLARKGLVSKVTGPDAKKILFAAEEPERLTYFLNLQKQLLEDRRSRLERVLPELRSLHLAGEERPRVRLFEGKEGLHILQQEFVNASADSIVSITPEDELYALFPKEEYHQIIRSVRLRAGIPSRNIYTTTGEPREVLQRDSAFLRESRFIPVSVLPVKASLAVHGPVFSLVSFRSKIIGVLIEHEDIANSFRVLFEVLWRFAGQLQREGSVTTQDVKVPLDTARSVPYAS